MDKNKKLDALFNETEDINFGCVCFDRQEIQMPDGSIQIKPMSGSGWASIAGKKSFRIKSISDLNNNIKWWSNLSKNDIYIGGKEHLNKLKHTGYLKTDMEDIMKELMMNPAHLTMASICEYLSAIFNKVMKLSIQFYNISSFEKEDFHTEIKNHLIGNDDNIGPHIDAAFLRSYQDFVICEPIDLNLDNNKKIVLKRPRVLHAKGILETKIPNDNQSWSIYLKENLPETREERIDFLVNKKEPFICKVNILEYNTMENEFIELSKLLNVGPAKIGPKKITKKDRDWMCQTEFLYYNQLATLDIEAVFSADTYNPQNFDDLIPDLGPLGNMSFSYGLLAECVWHAFAERSYDYQSKSKSLVTPRACWMKSTDKFLTLTSALMLASQGYKILSYGNGMVIVSVPENNIHKLIEHAPAAGLTVPRWLVEKYQLSKRT